MLAQTEFARLANAWDYRKADLYPTGKQFARRFYATDLKGSGNYHRAQLLNLLVSLLPEHARNQRVHFQKRLVHYANDATNGQVTMHFADGSTATSSVLIGADGIKSPTRQGMIAVRAALETDNAEKARILKHAFPRWSGMVAYRGLVSADEVAAILGEPHRCTKDRIMVRVAKTFLILTIHILCSIAEGKRTLSFSQSQWGKRSTWLPLFPRMFYQSTKPPLQRAPSRMMSELGLRTNRGLNLFLRRKC